MAKEKEEKSFEESLLRLETIVKDLENGSVPLDDAINKFTEAMNISKECNEKLKSAEENVNKMLKENGKLEDFQIEE